MLAGEADDPTECHALMQDVEYGTVIMGWTSLFNSSMFGWIVRLCLLFIFGCILTCGFMF